MSTIINEQEARERFESGHPVGIRRVGSNVDPVWQSAGDGWARTWEEFVTSPRWWGDDVETEFVRPRLGRRTLDEAAGRIFRREEFEIGNVSGTHFFLPGAHGDLDEEFRDDFESADYAVWSYETPIAWVRKDGTVFMPPLRYSQTTTRHQNLAARALGVSFTSERRAEAVADGGRTPYGPQGWGGAW